MQVTLVPLASISIGLTLLAALAPDAHASGGPGAPPRYDVVVLEAPSNAVAVNASRLDELGGAAGGFLNTVSSYFDALVWSPTGVPTKLSDSHGFLEANAVTLQGDGTVIGSGAFNPLQVSHAAVMHPDGTTTLLPSLAGNEGVVSIAFDVNSKGLLAGRSALFPTPFWLATANHAVLWDDGELIYLGSLGGYFADARRINDALTVIGSSNTAEDDYARGYVWDPVNGMREILPFLEGIFGQVSDLNEQDVICGYTGVGVAWQACVWPDPDGSPVLLPKLPGDGSTYALALDDAGHVVGNATDAGAGLVSEPRLWWNGDVYDLNALLDDPLPFPLPLEAALDINEQGQILARSSIDPELGQFHVVLSPVPALAADAPSISLAAGGVQTLALDAGPDCANAIYWLLGSASGTSPGIPAGGFILPLVPDQYLILTISAANLAPFGNTLGFLDGAGEGAATFTLPPAFDPTLAGIVLHHAYVVLDPLDVQQVLFASNAVPLTLAP